MRLRAPGRGAWLALAAGLAGVALAGPVLNLPRDSYEYLFVLDITQSMNTPDMVLQRKPASRIAYARQALDRALLALPCGSRAGLAVFTEYRSFLLMAPVEVCAGYTDLAATLARVDWRMGWAGGSEVSKGVHFARRLALGLASRPDVVFITDGHEAPPLNPRHRPRFEVRPGELKGLLVGVGGDVPVEIPKYDMEGKRLGVWQADQVQQVDNYSQGRAGTSVKETMVEEDGSPVQRAQTGGNEHLSSLREEHLRVLAVENGFGYLRLDRPEALGPALRDASLARRATLPTDLAPAAGALALACLGAAYFSRRTSGT